MVDADVVDVVVVDVVEVDVDVYVDVVEVVVVVVVVVSGPEVILQSCPTSLSCPSKDLLKMQR